MRPSWWRHSRIALVAFLPLLLPATSRAENEWLEVRSPNFSVITDAGEKRGREIAQRFEQMRYVFGTLVHRAKINVPAPLQIIGFRNGKGFREFSPLWKGKPVRAAGLFISGEDRNYILLDLSSFDPYAAVYHEYGHLLLNGNYPLAQPWFDEGFAEYFRSIKIMGKRAQVGGVPEGTWDVLSSARFFSIQDLFSIGQDSKVYNEDGDHRSMFYAQSWLVVHYLFDKSRMPQGGVYFDLVKNQRMPVAQAIEKAFGITPKQFDKEVEQYYRGRTLQAFSMDMPAVESKMYESKKLKLPDLQAILADVHLHTPDYLEKAVREFEAVLNTTPNHAASHRGLGYAYLRKNDFTRAAEHFRRAAALDSGDARVHYYSALLMNREALSEDGRIDKPNDMMIHLRRAIQIDPELADAYHLLAYLQLTHGSPNEAMESIKAALQRSPRNESYYSTLGQIFMAQRKWDEATQVFKRLEASENPGLAQNARTNIRLAADYKENVHRAEWADLQKRTRQKEWGTTPSAERLAEEAEKGDIAEPDPAPAVPDKRPVKFLKGRLVNVDCKDGRAVLTINAGTAVASLKRRGTASSPQPASGGRTVKLLVPNTSRVVLVGADDFSCEWRDQRVAVNYRAGGELDGEVMSVELQ